MNDHFGHMTQSSVRRRALITGITGQDGCYLARLLLDKGYDVHGLVRPDSVPTTQRIEDRLGHRNLHIHYGDLTDPLFLMNLVRHLSPDEIYNLAGQSHVGLSFETPLWTTQVNGLGILYLLEALRTNPELKNKTRLYQASTSEIFGNSGAQSQNETTGFEPVSPYACAKLYGHHITRTYREAYGIYACCGILFNHESPERSADFVSRKITQAAARISLGLEDKVMLGNLDARRDWGNAEDFVELMWRMLQQDHPEDFVIATGIQTTVRDFATAAFQETGISLQWRGTGLEEQAIDPKTGKIFIEIDPKLFRPHDVHYLCGDSRKAQERLGWRPDRTSLDALIRKMVAADLARARLAASQSLYYEDAAQ